ncbi:MAG TPA: efflux RND transporter periplasmic adaptor subunit [Candidatus Acidoferrales bacterium]|nr:efflux RND transporter periplasmic adaptor subunit [Candidatus Acidoferrales bacterium]
MKGWQKGGIAAGGVLALGIIAWVSAYQANKGVVTVQTAHVVRQDLTSLVTASGEIRPKNYTNVLGEGIGKITDIAVKEGDHVKKGDVLLHLENIQPGADVQAQKATIDAAHAGMRVASANYRAAVATLGQRKAELDKAKYDWQRSQQLYQAQIIAKQDYDSSKAAYDGAVAAVTAGQAQVDQAKASSEQARYTLSQAQAMLTHQADILRKTTYRAPIGGIVSYIAVRVGENVVPGIQNAEGSFLMTISDMSIVTAEVKVDETDITYVRDGQPVSVEIDALPGKTFRGHVTEVGEDAILRTSGQTAMTETTANTQEARDFKVVVTLDNPPQNLRPGLSATAKIETAHRHDVLSIPIQALAMRSKQELAEARSGTTGGRGVTLAAPNSNDTGAQKSDIQGVFVIRGRKAEFVPVQTGVSGITDIEVTSGLHEGDEIVTGSYKVLRDLKPGATIKVDNSIPQATQRSS